MQPTQINIQSLTLFGTWLWTTSIWVWRQQHYNHQLVLLLPSKLPVSAWSQLDREEITHIVLAVAYRVYFNRVKTVFLNTPICECKWNNKRSEIISYSQLCLYCNVVVTRKALNDRLYHDSLANRAHTPIRQTLTLETDFAEQSQIFSLN